MCFAEQIYCPIDFVQRKGADHNTRTGLSKSANHLEKLYAKSTILELVATSNVSDQMTDFL